jgi:ureidoacrylate peracid hydrolase
MAGPSFSPSPTELSEILAPARTALLVIDVQNDFGHADGVMGAARVDMTTVDPAVSAAGRLVDSAHAAGAPVIFVGLQTSAQLDSRSATLRRARLGQPYSENKRVCRKGTWGADWYRLRPTDADISISKARYSSFQDTELDLQLKALGVDTLVVCGLTTECCVETAVRDAFHRDYNVFVAGDACASYDPELHAVSLRTMAIYCALILDAHAVVQAWS